MKKFILLLVLTAVLLGAFYVFLTSTFTSSAIEYPLGAVGLLILVVIGGGGLLAFWGTLNSAPLAWKELKFCYRRRQSRLKIKRSRQQGQQRQGATTVVSN